MSKRKYNSEYIKYEFIAIQHREEYLPQCVVCMKTFLNEAVKPILLKNHFESNHPEKKDKNAQSMSKDKNPEKKYKKSYFERLGENVKKQRLDQTVQNYQEMEGIVKASHKVSLLV